MIKNIIFLWAFLALVSCTGAQNGTQNSAQNRVSTPSVRLSSSELNGHLIIQDGSKNPLPITLITTGNGTSTTTPLVTNNAFQVTGMTGSFQFPAANETNLFEYTWTSTIPITDGKLFFCINLVTTPTPGIQIPCVTVSVTPNSTSGLVQLYIGLDANTVSDSLKALSVGPFLPKLRVRNRVYSQSSAQLCQGDCGMVMTFAGQTPSNGLQMDVSDGSVAVTNAAGAQVVTAGQYGPVGSSNAIVPASQGMQGTMPSFMSSNKSGGMPTATLYGRILNSVSQTETAAGGPGTPAGTQARTSFLNMLAVSVDSKVLATVATNINAIAQAAAKIPTATAADVVNVVTKFESALSTISTVLGSTTSANKPTVSVGTLLDAISPVFVTAATLSSATPTTLGDTVQSYASLMAAAAKISAIDANTLQLVTADLAMIANAAIAAAGSTATTVTNTALAFATKATNIAQAATSPAVLTSPLTVIAQAALTLATNGGSADSILTTASGASSVASTTAGGGGGTINTPWGTTGIVTTAIGGVESEGKAVAMQTDGKVVIVGTSGASMLIARYNSNGTLDTNFATTGKIVKSIGSGSDTANAVAIQSDGKIVVVGETNSGDDDFAVLRYNTDGSIDTTFATSGVYTLRHAGGDDSLSAVVIQTDGKIVVAGTYAGTTEADFAVARLTSEGVLDPTFGTGGIVTKDISGTNHNNALNAMIMQTDGKFIVVGSKSDGTQKDFAMARFTPSGELDTTFNTTGIVTLDFLGFDDTAKAIAISSDQTTIVVGGSASDGSHDQSALAMYNSTGTLITSFGASSTIHGTKLYASTGGDAKVNAVSILSDGMILAAGQSYNGTNTDSDLRKFDSTATLVSSFGTSGIVTIDISNHNNLSSSAMTIQSDSKILCVGSASLTPDSVAVIRYKATGALDSQ